MRHTCPGELGPAVLDHVASVLPKPYAFAALAHAVAEAMAGRRLPAG